MRFALLLRGVNVGGNNKVPKKELRNVLEKNDCRDVIVYLNSGNAVFTANDSITIDKLANALEKHFGFIIPCLLLPGAQVKEIANKIPKDWTNDSVKPGKPGQKSDVLYLFQEVDTPDILNQLGYNSDIEQMIYVKGAIITNISRVNQSRGTLQKIVGTKIYSQVTIRNVNTARKLAELI